MSCIIELCASSLRVLEVALPDPEFVSKFWSTILGCKELNYLCVAEHGNPESLAFLFNEAGLQFPPKLNRLKFTLFSSCSDREGMRRWMERLGGCRRPRKSNSATFATNTHK